MIKRGDKNILVISTIGLGYEGMTAVIYNYLSNMDLSGISIDILSFEDDLQEANEKFAKFVNIIVSPNRKKNTRAYVKFLRELLKKKNYDVIHVHGNSGTMMIESVLARRYKVKKILVHCHNTQCDHPYLNIIMRQIMKALATDFLACSDVAGKYLYGRSKYIVIKNAIDLDAFKYNPIVRDEVRKEFGVGDEILIGHVGHFTPQKNHFFLIDVFAVFHKKHMTSKLLLVSDGRDLEKVKEKVKRLELDNAVIFAGNRSDCGRLYQAMDLFVLPSRWEGLPLVTVEAQMAGVGCVVSDAVPLEAVCTDRVFRIPLAEGVDEWVTQMERILEQEYDRNVLMDEQVRQRGFDIVVEADRLKNIYLR